MHAPTTRIFTLTRIVALTLIGLVVLGLAYLRFAPDGGSVSVPKGAHAGQLALERAVSEFRTGSEMEGRIIRSGL